MKKKIATISHHPIQYHAPLFKELSLANIADFDVLYCSDFGTSKAEYDPDFGVKYQWDIDLLSGYDSKFLTNISPRNTLGFFKHINVDLPCKLIIGKYDVVFINTTHTQFSGWLSLFSAKILGKKVFWRNEATLKINPPGLLKAFLKRLLLWPFFNWSDVIFYSCTGNYEHNIYWGANKKKLKSFPCAVDNDFFQREYEKYKNNRVNIRTGNGVKDSDFVVAISGKLIDRKRPYDLIEAVSLIKCKKDIVLLFIGDGHLKDMLEAMAAQLSVNALFVGFKNQTEISQYLISSDCYAIVSDYDPSPKALNEAMNFSLPIIVTSIVGTSSDLVKNDENGYIINAGDISSLARKIEYLSMNKLHAREMGKLSRGIVEQWSFKKDVSCFKSALEAF